MSDMSVQAGRHNCPGLAQRYMHIIAALSLVLAVPALCGQQSASTGESGFVNTLMPLPATVIAKPGELRVDSSFSFGLRDNSNARLRRGCRL